MSDLLVIANTEIRQDAKGRYSLYLIELSNGLIKIGVSGNIVRRLREHARNGESFGNPVSKIKTFPCKGDHLAAESRLIERCASVATETRGKEWFVGISFDQVAIWAEEEASKDMGRRATKIPTPIFFGEETISRAHRIVRLCVEGMAGFNEHQYSAVSALLSDKDKFVLNDCADFFADLVGLDSLTPEEIERAVFFHAAELVFVQENPMCFAGSACDGLIKQAIEIFNSNVEQYAMDYRLNLSMRRHAISGPTKDAAHA